MSESQPDHPATFHVWIEIVAPAGVESTTREKFVDAIVNAPKPGFLGARIFEHADDTQRFFSLQEWEDSDAFDQHMRESEEGLRRTNPLLAGPPSVTPLRRIGL
jgi:quinol monooxygenase YgiN